MSRHQKAVAVAIGAAFFLTFIDAPWWAAITGLVLLAGIGLQDDRSGPWRIAFFGAWTALVATAIPAWVRRWPAGRMDDTGWWALLGIWIGLTLGFMGLVDAIWPRRKA